MTKHTSAHLKILVGGFCQKKKSKLSANSFHPKNINETRCHFKSVLVALTTTTTAKFAKDIEIKKHDIHGSTLILLQLQIERTLNYMFNLDFSWGANQTLGSFFFSESDK